jgi:hypothetical protein
MGIPWASGITGSDYSCRFSFLGGLVVGAILMIAVFDPSLLKLRGTVEQPKGPPKPPPGSSVVDPLAKDWDLNSAHVQWAPVIPLAQISDSAYSDGESLETTLIEWGLTAYEPIEDGASFGYVASNDRTIVVAFRGTNELIDWTTNLDLKPTQVPHGSVHHGFYTAVSSLSEEVFIAADRQGVSSKKLWITGHSLGGAMALLFANACVNRGIEPAGLVTFGQPMLCDGKIARHLNSRLDGKYVRFVHGGDAVTRMVPPYCHCGNLVWFTEGTYKFDRPLVPVAAVEDGTTGGMIEYRIGPKPFTSKEFDALRQPNARRRPFRRRRDNEPIDKVGSPAAYEDHAMAGYIHWVATCAARDNVTADPPGQVAGASGW